jgi:hypothetical protein
MSLLDGGGAALLARIFSPLYLPGRVYTNLTVYDRYGEPSTVVNATPCRIQIDAMTEAMRAAEGAADGDRRAIVLAGEGLALDTDAEVSADSGPYSGSRWLVMSIDRDPLGSYWQCRVRRNPVAQP